MKNVLHAGLCMCAFGCMGGGADGTATSASVSGEVGELVFGPTVSAIAATPWGIDDGLHVIITDAQDPCGAWTEGRRQPNTSTLVLGFADVTVTSSNFVLTEAAGAGDYTFVTELHAPGRWFSVVRAYRLDGSCVPAETGIGAAVSGSGTLDTTTPLSGGRAVGSFSADFAGGSLHGTFSAPFCNEPMIAPDYFDASSLDFTCSRNSIGDSGGATAGMSGGGGSGSGGAAGTGGGSASGSCTDGTKSMDPCPQAGTSCASVGGVAVACCVGGQFEQQIDPMTGRITTKCQCEQAAQGVVVTCSPEAGGAGGGATCGNGMLNAGEQCDGAQLGGATCMSLNLGTGMLQCSPSCTYDTAMCTGG